MKRNLLPILKLCFDNDISIEFLISSFIAKDLCIGWCKDRIKMASMSDPYINQLLYPYFS